MKHSIRLRIILTLALLIMSTIFLCWFVNKQFLSDYYEHSKIEMLSNVYSEVEEAYEKVADPVNMNDGEAEEFGLKLEKLAENKNMSLYSFYFNVYSTLSLEEGIVFIYPEGIQSMDKKQITEKIVSILKYQILKGYKKNIEQEIEKDSEQDAEHETEQGSNQKERLEEKARVEIKTTDSYAIYKVYDERIDANYLEMFGEYENGTYIYLRTNFNSIQESVELSNKFLGYVGIFATILGIVIMFFISRSFTKPILQLSNIAKRMSNLDFDTKYEVKTKDEIGILGTSINILSEKLEGTISELKSANNELKTDLEHKIQIDEMRKEFLSNVSHELKTPISLIQGYAEGLIENINDEDGSKDFYCEVIMDEASKMNKMVKKLISLNQIEFGSNEINIERFDIVALVQSVLLATNILFQQKEVVLHFEHKDPIYVWADEYLVEEVVTNYISNALNHVSGSNIIEVKLIQIGEVIRVAIFNSGENIPEDDLDKIWIKFYKVDKARTREYGGSGIGLSIVKAIMTSLNHECGAINHETGVEFWFELDAKNE